MSTGWTWIGHWVMFPGLHNRSDLIKYKGNSKHTQNGKDNILQSDLI